MNNKQLKKLAEQHFYLGKTLTPQEKFLLESSKYKKIVKNKNTKFNKVMEQYSNFLEEEPQFKPRYVKRKKMFVPGINKDNINDLIDDIEEKYNLGIENPSPAKYNNVDLEDVKHFITQFAEKNVFDKPTQLEINDVLDSDSIYTILHKLYSLQ